MARLNIEEKDPVRFAQVRAHQLELMNEHDLEDVLFRKCPYCGHMIQVLYKGRHAPSQLKCNGCGQLVFCPEVSFRLAS